MVAVRRFVDNTALRFIAVGIINTLVGTLTMIVLYNLAHTGYWIATAANYIVGSIVSYLLNRNFTFRHKGRQLKSIARFVANILVCYLLAYGIARPAAAWLFAGQSSLIQDNIAMLTGMVLFVSLNYLGQRFVVFPHRYDEQNGSADNGFE
jgi:putative flippase GtrA